MSVKIRCRRTGARNDPCFRIVVADIRSPRDGKFLEILGWYHPKKKENDFYLNLERIEVWKNKGAQLSDMVKSLMRKAKAGAMSKPSITVETPPKVDASQPAAESVPDAQSSSGAVGDQDAPS